MPQPPFTALTLAWPTRADFVEYWSQAYAYPDAELYDPIIGQTLTEERLWALFRWKNGGTISAQKQASIRANYPVTPPANPTERYLDPKAGGGAIWNIFYLHCLDPERWPIYDQHTHRAMVWILESRVAELPTSGTIQAKAAIYASYQDRYIPFIHEQFARHDQRHIDRALFAFGQLLKRLKDHLPT